MQKLLLRLGAAAGVALLVLVGVLLAVLPSQGEARALSVFSDQPSGLRVLFLLCESLGFPAAAWSEAPGHLAGRGTVLVLAHLPPAPPPVPAALAGDPAVDAPLRRSRDLAHYRRFVEEGGTLLLLDLEGDEDAAQSELDFLRDTLALPGLADVESESLLTGGVARDVVLVGDERLELASHLRRSFRGPGPDEILARADDGSALAFARAVGAGRVVLASLPIDWFDNHSLAKDGAPALVFVRLLEQLGPVEHVLFDEYALGGWRPVPVMALAFSPRLAWFSVHLLLLFLVLGWRSAWSGPFARDPESYLAASPLARARGFGRTLARAGRWDLLASLLRRGFLARWAARAGGRVAQGEADLEARLRLLARGDEQRHARLFELFLARAPADERELAALESDLGALEHELFGAADRHAAARKTRRGVGAHPRT